MITRTCGLSAGSRFLTGRLDLSLKAQQVSVGRGEGAPMYSGSVKCTQHDFQAQAQSKRKFTPMRPAPDVLTGDLSVPQVQLLDAFVSQALRVCFDVRSLLETWRNLPDQLPLHVG